MKTDKIIIILCLIFCTIITQSNAQSTSKSNSKNSLGPNHFPELVFTNISGAPKLDKPQLIMGDTIPVMGEGNGWAAPAVYDWNDDGKKDLLIGEFATGSEKGIPLGHLIRVYQNIGTDDNPKFGDFYIYAKGVDSDTSKDFTNGLPLSIHTFCCLPFTPRFADLNNDGFMDLLSGQYSPGYISWFRGSKYGFSSGEALEEVYNVKARNKAYSLPFTNPDGMNYWQYSSAAFGDFDDDGDKDMIVGGGALRMSKNIGTKYKPIFGKRELLLDINGDPLKIHEISNEKLTDSMSLYNPIYKDESYYFQPPPSGVSTTVPYVVDWDQDGVLDLLVTYSFTYEGRAVTYFRGQKTKDGIRFEVGVPLFKAKNGEKEFPGSYLNLCVTDWNNDGINDLLIGTKIVTHGSVFNHELSWNWGKYNGMPKGGDPAYYSTKKTKEIEQLIESANSNQKKLGLTDKEMEESGYFTEESIIKMYYGNAGYINKTLAHKGYVYLLLGKKDI